MGTKYYVNVVVLCVVSNNFNKELLDVTELLVLRAFVAGKALYSSVTWMQRLSVDDGARDLIYLRTNAVIQCGRGGLERRHIALADLLYRRRLQRVQTLVASVSCILKKAIVLMLSS